MSFAGMPASKTQLPAEPLCLIFGDEDFLVRDRASQVYEGWCADAGGEDHEIIDGTVRNAAEALVEKGATSVHAYVTHGVLSGGAVARVLESPMEKLVITDSIQSTEAVRVSHNIDQLTIAPLMAEAIRRISEETSVSSLFD